MKRLSIFLLCFVLSGCSQLFIRNQKNQFDIKASYFDNTTLEIQSIINDEVASFNSKLILPDFKLKQASGEYYTHISKISDDLSLELETDDVTTKIYRLTIKASITQENALKDAGYLYEVIMDEATKNNISSIYLSYLHAFLNNPSSGSTLPIEVIEDGILYQAFYHQNTIHLVVEKTESSDLVTQDWHDMHLDVSDDEPRALITKISLAAYNNIQEGMTYEEVVAIVGAEGILVFEPTTPDDEYVSKIYTWLGNGSLGSNASLTFENNHLKYKTQHNLK